VWVFGVVSCRSWRWPSERRLTSRGRHNYGRIAARRIRAAGASVFVDGRLSGETPVTLTTIPVGVHRVRVVRLGYLENSRMVTIRAGVPAVLRARLTDPAPQTANATALRIVVLEGEAPSTSSSRRPLSRR
jgi:hypothetical protein